MPLFEYKSYQGKREIYNLININCEKMDEENSSELKSEIVSYFQEEASQLEGKRNCLNLKKVKDMDSSGLSALLVFKRLNKRSKYPDAVLTGCQDEIKKSLINMGYDTLFEFVDNEKDL